MIDIEVEDSAWTDALPDPEALVRAAAEAALGREHGHYGVTLLLADDAAVRELNQRSSANTA